MAYENVRLRKPNFAMVNGYFWMVDNDTDSVVVKTDDGTLAYSYPLDTTLGNTVLSLEFDGFNIWTLQSAGTDAVSIKRWYINNYVCTLRDEFQLVPGPSHKYNCNTFTIEHYHTQFSADEAAGQSVLSVLDASNMESGYVLVLGPNHLGQMEEVSVSSAGGGSVQINGSTQYEYRANAPISFYKRIWLFNNYDGISTATGALYNIDAYTGSVITKYPGGAYKDILSCTFFDIPKYVFDRSVGPAVTEPRYNSICYIKGTNMIFLDPSDLANSFGSMTMDNIRSDQATNIGVYDVTMEGTNVYRLQTEATYYGSTKSFADGTYNYQLSSLNSFITSISLRANPAILPANGVNPSTITAIVKDQFGLPVEARQVFFTDDDPAGSITVSPVNTDSDGIAITTYIAGTSAREVRVTATAQQI
jgi:hypothetical protein